MKRRHLHFGESITQTNVIAQEGFFSTVLDMFKKKKEASKEELPLPSLNEWMSKNIKNGKLDPELVPKTSAFKLPISDSAIFFDGRQPVRDVGQIVSRFTTDYLELRRIYAKHLPVILEIEKVSKELDRVAFAAWKTKQDQSEESWKKLQELVLKYESRIPKSVLSQFQEPTHKFIGSHKTGFVGKLYGDKSFLYSETSTLQRVDSVTFEKFTIQDLGKLEKLAKTIGQFGSEVFDLENKLYPGIDQSDLPWRAFSDEIEMDDEVTEILHPLSHPILVNENTGLINIITQRLWYLEAGLWNLIRVGTEKRDSGDHEFR